MILELLSKNYTEIRHTPVAAIPAGTLTALNDTYGFPISDVAANTEGSFVVKAEKVRGPKGTDQTFAEGEAIYWENVTNDDLDNVAGALPLLGICFEASALANTTAIIEFDGFAAFLKA
jgi:predicted RecA/RadA family phage recombinase